MGSSSPLLRLGLHGLLLLSLYVCVAVAAKSPDSEALIKKTCKATPYYSLCLSSIRAAPTAATTAHLDTKALAVIIITTASSNATAASTYLSSQLLSAGASSVSPPLAVARLCADKYSTLNDSLQSALQDLASEMYDYASVDVAAAAAYPDACKNAFKRASAAYPTELAKREVALKRICAVALGIINLLIAQQSN